MRPDRRTAFSSNGHVLTAKRVNGLTGIVLENDQPPAGAQKLPQLSKERHVLVGIDVMEHAGREDEIETGMGQRQRAAVVANERGDAWKSSGGDLEALLRDVERRDAGCREGPREMRQRVADAGAEIQDAVGSRSPVGRPAPKHFVDLVAGEIFRVLAAEADVPGVSSQIFLGELIEFGWLHDGPGSTGAAPARRPRARR